MGAEWGCYAAPSLLQVSFVQPKQETNLLNLLHKENQQYKVNPLDKMLLFKN